ncbi:MAG: hypothetical protein FWB73_00905 [Treponema sp.]|nr:hypothetical protein [Treponema sp.]
MDIKELEKWVTTNEGQQWLEAQKKGLLDKNNELLEKITGSNATNKTLNERITSLESDLLKSQAVVNDTLLSKPLKEKLKQKGVFEVLIPELSKTISDSYAIQIVNGNAIGKVKGNETELTLDQIIESWSKSDQAKDSLKPQEIKTQSTSADFKQGITPTVDRELAAMRKGAGLPENKE